jgi:enoyl-CoA hydratase/carnithine racemase
MRACAAAPGFAAGRVTQSAPFPLPRLPPAGFHAMPSELLTERHDATLVLTLSDPERRNALSPQIYAAAIEALGVAEADAGVRCVLLRGDGAHFCAGGNLQRLAHNRSVGPDEQRQSIERFHTLIEALRSFPKPVLAAVEGYAAGGGFSLALACDLIIAAENARFVMSYGKVGLSPDGGGSWHLAQMLPRALALRTLWLAEPLEPRELQRFGLVQWVTDSGQAFAESLRVAARLAQMAPNALASAKELVNQARQQGLREQLAAERDHFVANLFDANGAEGLQAFFDKRPPRFA